MKRIKWPFYFGCIILISAVIYDILFAGIPYLDPTPDMRMRWEFHKGIASYLYFIGVFMFIAGILATAFAYIKNKVTKPTTKI
jgi:hypothetical protein